MRLESTGLTEESNGRRLHFTGFHADGTPFGVTLLAPARHDAMLASIGRVFHAATALPLGALGCPQPPLAALPVGKAEVRREGRSGLLILAFGAPLTACATVAESHDATLVNMRFVKPLDENLIVTLAARHRALVTIEENATRGGAGSAVGELLASEGVQVPLLQLGIPDRFIEHGSREGCLAAAGLDAAGLSTNIERWWAGQPQQRLRSAGAGRTQ